MKILRNLIAKLFKSNKTHKKICEKSFWDTDLDDIERQFLPDGIKVTDLPIHYDRRIN